MGFHKDVAENNMHEPKGMTTLTGGASDVGKVVVSKGDGTTETRQIAVGEVTDNEHFKYSLILDTTYTSIAKRAIPAAKTSVVVNNDIIVENPTGFNTVWDGTDLFTPEGLDHVYFISLRFSADTATANDFFDICFEDAVTGTLFQCETKAFVKAAGTAVQFTFNVVVFAGSPFISNGGKFYITPQNAINMWDTSLTISRGQKPF
jgi:hypothetical protein